MSAAASLPDHASEVAPALRRLADQALAVASETTLVFVTNLHDGNLSDIGPDGVLNTAQYYSQAQADEIIRSLQSLGVTVRSFFSEHDFIVAATSGKILSPSKARLVVYTTAEGGTGSGRRALIPALCQLLGLPFLNSGPHACSIARHKFHSNAVLTRVGVRVPATWMYSRGGWLNGLRPSRGTRVIVKPTYESMGIGVHDDSVTVVATAFEDFVRSRTAAFGQPAIVQEFVSGEEVGVPVMGARTSYALPIVAFRKRHGEQYGGQPKTFDDENVARDVSRHLFDASPEQYRAIQEAALTSFEALEMRGAARIDFRVDADGRAWVFDTNESPPPLAPTAFSVAFKALGFSLQEMLAVWLGACLADHRVTS